MKGRLNKNIYMGQCSTAQIPVHNKVDTSHEILLNILATGYDALNNVMLTKRSGFFDKTTVQEINGRFGILRVLSNRNAPRMLKVVDEIYGIVLNNYHNRISDMQALISMRDVCIRHNVDPSFLDQDLSLVMIQVNNAEMQSKQNKQPILFPFWLQPVPGKKNKRDRGFLF